MKPWHPARSRVELHAFALWQDGLLDIEIAARLDCHEDTVSAWRKRNALPSNVGGRVLARLDEFGREMHADGMTDREIAERIGCKPCTVCNWRKRHRLASNGDPGSEAWLMSLKKAIAGREAVAVMHGAGLTDREGARQLGISVGAFVNRRVRLGLKPNKGKR